MDDLIKGLLLLVDSISSSVDAVRNFTRTAEEMGKVMADTFERLEAPYREAGYPFGRNPYNTGMWIWYEYGQHTTVN